MQSTASVHPETVNRYNPPQHIAKAIIKHAIRNIPGKQALLDKMEPKKYSRLFGLKAHEYNSTGQLQFGFQN